MATSDQKFRRGIMKGNKHMKTITNTTYPAFALFAFACFSFAPATRAQCPQMCDGAGNTAIGDSALDMNTGFSNTATGNFALSSGNTGSENTATGAGALTFNTSGGSNTASGALALESNTTGGNNTATGAGALQFNTIGIENTANGDGALNSNTTGSSNTALGFNALAANSTTSFNIAVGANAGSALTTGSNNIDIGHVGAANDSRIIRIGTTGTQRKTFIAGISGATVASGVGVIIGSNGQLGTVVSSERFKDAVQPMDKASEAILSLQPVTFHYKKELDPEAIPQFGLVAEEVEKVNPDLVARDEQGKPYTVRYEAVNAMLLNEFLKEHREVQELKKQVAALNAGLQRISAQFEVGKAAPQITATNQ